MICFQEWAGLTVRNELLIDSLIIYLSVCRSIFAAFVYLVIVIEMCDY